MKVDRARFLLLTGAIGAATALALTGASGCTVVQKTSGSDGGGSTSNPETDSGSSTTDGGGTTVKDDAGTTTSDCLGSGSSDAGALDCSTLAANGCDVYCDTYATNFKPAIAKAIADCLVKLPTCEGGMDAMKACTDAALAKACDDPSAKTFCTPVASECAKNDAGAEGLTQSSCEGLAKGLSEQGRTDFLSCIDEGSPGYCTYASAFCVDAFK